MKHQYMEPSDPHACTRLSDSGSCWLCDGGLAMCKVCKQAECELEDTCPGPALPSFLKREKKK